MRARNAALSTFITLTAACGVFGSSDDPPPAVTPPTEEGTEEPGPLPEAPPPPPISGTPVVGVFVSSSKGDDANDSTMARPLKTLASAIARAKEKALPVIACAEEFREAVVLVDGVTMYGYFDCSSSDWKRGEEHATIASPTSPAVLADGLGLPTRFEGFDVRSPDLEGKGTDTTPAASSYGMIVKGTTNLELAEVSIVAGSAQAGADGGEAAPNEQLKSAGAMAGGGADKQKVGCADLIFGCADIQFVSGAAGGSSECKIGPSGGPGGRGGDGRLFDPGERGAGAVYNGRPLVTDATTAAGGPEVKSGVDPAGKDGAKGATGNAGTNGAWSFGDTGFVPGDGTAGANGAPGQGGGGGGGSRWHYCSASWDVCSPVSGPLDPEPYFRAARGAGGGAGGCGGIAGAAGNGGGASIGLFVVDSQLTIKSSRIEARAGGAAGKGALGTTGTPGGAGGTSPQTYEWGGRGGKGGDGGDAGPSGHGAPGPSIAFAYKGARPNVDASVSLVPGAAGAGQPAMIRGDKTVPAVSGVAKAEHAF